MKPLRREGVYLVSSELLARIVAGDFGSGPHWTTVPADLRVIRPVFRPGVPDGVVGLLCSSASFAEVPEGAPAPILKPPHYSHESPLVDEPCACHGPWRRTSSGRGLLS